MPPGPGCLGNDTRRHAALPGRCSLADTCEHRSHTRHRTMGSVLSALMRPRRPGRARCTVSLAFKAWLRQLPAPLFALHKACHLLCECGHHPCLTEWYSPWNSSVPVTPKMKMKKKSMPTTLRSSGTASKKQTTIERSDGKLGGERVTSKMCTLLSLESGGSSDANQAAFLVAPSAQVSRTPLSTYTHRCTGAAAHRVMVRSGRSARSARSARTPSRPAPPWSPMGMNVVYPAATWHAGQCRQCVACVPPAARFEAVVQLNACRHS